MTATEAHMRIQRYRFLAFDGSDAPPPPAAKEVIPAVVLSAEEAPPPPPPPPMFSEQQVEQIRISAYQEGATAGKQEAENAAQRMMLENAATQQALLEIIANRITLAAEAHQNYLAGQKALMGRTILAIARKMAGKALHHEPDAPLEALLTQCAGLVAGSNRIVVIVASGRGEGLGQATEKLRAMLGDFQGEIVVSEDTTLDTQDCRVEWKNGQAVYDHEALWREIEALIAQTLTS